MISSKSWTAMGCLPLRVPAVLSPDRVTGTLPPSHLQILNGGIPGLNISPAVVGQTTKGAINEPTSFPSPPVAHPTQVGMPSKPVCLAKISISWQGSQPWLELFIVRYAGVLQQLGTQRIELPSFWGQLVPPCKLSLPCNPLTTAEKPEV